MKSKLLLTLSLVIVMLVAGCARMTMRHDLGDDNVANIEAQTINPEAGKKPVTHTLTGQKAQHVIDNYHSQAAEVSDERLVDDVSSN